MDKPLIGNFHKQPFTAIPRTEEEEEEEVARWKQVAVKSRRTGRLRNESARARWAVGLCACMLLSAALLPLRGGGPRPPWGAARGGGSSPTTSPSGVFHPAEALMHWNFDEPHLAARLCLPPLVTYWKSIALMLLFNMYI